MKNVLFLLLSLRRILWKNYPFVFYSWDEQKYWNRQCPLVKLWIGLYLKWASVSSENLNSFCLLAFFSFPADAFLQPVLVRFLLIAAVLGAVVSTQFPPKRSIIQMQKREHSSGRQISAERRMIFPNSPKSTQYLAPRPSLSFLLLSLQSCTFLPNLFAIICRSPISAAQLYTEKLSLTTDHTDSSFSWDEDVIPKFGRNCLSYKMSYMPLKMSLKFTKTFSLNVRIWPINKPIPNILKEILFTGIYQLSQLLFACVW